MAKTRAEIQRAYRERKKKKEGDKYLDKERQRRKRNYVPSSQLNRVQRLRRNEKNRKYLRIFREREKAAIEFLNQESDDSFVEESSGYESRRSSFSNENEKLIVQLPALHAAARRLGPMRRTSRALAKAYRTIGHMKYNHAVLMKKYGALKKCLTRRRPENISKTNTPNSKTDALMEEANLNINQRNIVRKRILLSNVIIAEVIRSKNASQKRKKTLLHQVMSGKIVKKYRCLRMLARETGLCRHKMSTSNKSLIWNKGKRTRELQLYKSTVVAFLERDDVSRAQPGKCDAKVNTEGIRVQTRVLTDYTGNLHAKFLSENPTVKLSLTTFRRLRPRHILLTSFTSRHSCLCTRHQNMALHMKMLRRVGIVVPANPEVFIKECVADIDTIIDQVPEKVMVSQWKRVSVEEKGRQKQVTRIVEAEVTAATFKEDFKVQVNEFIDHVFRMRNQYAEIRNLKEHLPVHHMIVHMDFAENYSCKTVDEIQSAYWNQTAVTLHPIVVYFKDKDGCLQHQSIVAVSDEMSHQSSTVLAILNKVIPVLKDMDEDLEMIHYWTDSPTSQYRNKFIFSTVANHEELYQVKARWNYFEAGHGKGPCDGLGGITKRMADEAVRSGKMVIQHATDFFNWAKTSNMKSVQFMFVSSDECKDVAMKMESQKCVAVKGTMKIHAVCSESQDTISVKDISCYCDECLSGRVCADWRVICLVTPTVRQRVDRDNTTETMESEKSTTTCKYAINDYVTAMYDHKWYVGKILDIDQEDDTLNITFMERKKMLYQWPCRPDTIWCPVSDILSPVQEPQPCGKSKRMYKLSPADMNISEKAFEAYRA